MQCGAMSRSYSWTATDLYFAGVSCFCVFGGGYHQRLWGNRWEVFDCMRHNTLEVPSKRCYDCDSVRDSNGQ